MFMNSKMKKALTLVLAAIMVVGCLAGCSGKQASTTEAPAKAAAEVPTQEYYMITFLSGLEYWSNCYSGFEDAAKLFPGAKPVYTGALEFDINEMITIIDQVLVKKPAGIAISCPDAEALIDPINKAMDAGVPVVCFDSDAPNSNRLSIVSVSNISAGKAAAEIVAEAVGGEGEVAIIYTAGVPTTEDRNAGFTSTMAEKYPNIKVVSANFDGEADSAAKATASLMSANPNLKAIFTTNSPGAAGTATAVKEAGKINQIKVVGFDDNENVLMAIKDGDIYATIAQGPYNQGYWAMNLLYQYANQSMNPVDGWKENNINPLPNSIDTGTIIITQDNIDLFLKK